MTPVLPHNHNTTPHGRNSPRQSLTGLCRQLFHHFTVFHLFLLRGCVYVLPVCLQCSQATGTIHLLANTSNTAHVLQDGAAGWAMTDEALIWAKSTVWSRAFNIPYLGACIHNTSQLAVNALCRPCWHAG